MAKSKTSIIGLKDLRENTQEYIEAVSKGQSFMVVRKSKPVLRISSPIDEDSQELWETIVDFTKIRKGGIPIDELLSRL
jgi:prevent-host-death family protein